MLDQDNLPRQKPLCTVYDLDHDFPLSARPKAYVFAKDSNPIRATTPIVSPRTRPMRGVPKIQGRYQTFWFALEKPAWKFSLYVADLLLSKVGILYFDFDDRGTS